MTTAWDYLAAFIAIGALAIGLISMAVGQIMKLLDRQRAPRRPAPRRRVMSRPAPARRRKRQYASIYIPVSSMPYQAGGMDAPPRAAPDMDAPHAGMPTLSRDITDDALLAFLAVVRGKDGKPRYSANAIHGLVGGDRNTVLAKIKEIRSGPSAPIYPPRTPEQRQLREELGIG